ncbi:MAG: DUF692 domain-containing protein [Myxococcales bacterium]|nr:DUF692 domain-containing protein [Myxococcales bacterium]
MPRGRRGVTPGPPAGVGIGLRREHFDSILQTERPLDWLEIVPENFIGHGGRAGAVLDACRERWPIGVHGVALSLGGPDPLDLDLLDGLAAVLDRVGATAFTEHLCFARAGGENFYDLLPLPFTRAAVDHVAARVRAARERLGCPILLENVSTYAVMPGAEMSEGAFVTAVLEAADCGLLLDVNNVFVNAHNHGTDPLDDLAALPLERAGRIHLAGHTYVDDLAIDNHGAPVIEPVWALYRAALEAAGPVPTLIEWDLHVPPLERVLDEADRARALMRAVCG